MRFSGTSTTMAALTAISFLIISCSAHPKTIKKDLSSKANRLFSESDSMSTDMPAEMAETKAADPAAQTPAKQSAPDKSAVPEQPETFTFEETGEGIASKFERNIDAEKRAEDDALSKALKKAGTDSYYGFSDVLAQQGKTQYQYVSRYLYTWSAGLASWEINGQPSFTNEPGGGTKCILTIKGKIISKGAPDPAYEIRFDNGNNALGLDKPEYFAGDEIHLNFRATKDSYISILNVDEDQNVYLIYPNNYAQGKILKAGEVLEIPGKLPITLKAALPEGRAQTLELLHIIATKKEPLFSTQETVEKTSGGYRLYSLGGLKNVTQRLAKLERQEWTQAVLTYGIRAR